MRNCPTGYCGDPCLCKGALDHVDASEAKRYQQLATQRLLDIGAAEMSKEHGEPMVAYPAVEVKLAALRYDGKIVECDHLLHRAVLYKTNKGIATVSGVRTVILDQDGNPTFVAGADRRSMSVIRFEVLDWKGNISASLECFGGFIKEAFIKLEPTTVYLPADME